MLKLNKSEFSISNSRGEIISKSKRFGNISLLGTAFYDYSQKGYFATVEITPDYRRDLRYFSLYADGSPCDTWVSNGKIYTRINLKEIPNKFELKWFEDTREFPNIFGTLVEYINLKGYKHINREKTNTINYLWIYDIEPLATDTTLVIHPIKPLNFHNRLVVFKVTNGRAEEVYSGSANKNKIEIPIKFNLEELKYENFQVFLNWYNDKGVCIPEIIKTEFVRENYPDINIQLPIVNIDDSYLGYYGKSAYKVINELNNKKTIIDYNGLLEGSPVEINFKFPGRNPEYVKCMSLRYNNSEIRDLHIEEYDGYFSLEIPNSLFQNDKIESAVLYMIYNFVNTNVEHLVDITKIYRK